MGKFDDRDGGGVAAGRVVADVGAVWILTFSISHGHIKMSAIASAIAADSM